MRLEIRPGLTRAWRAPGRLQLGVDPERGVVLDGLSADDERVLALVDGTGTLDGLLRRARRLRLSPARAREVVATLVEAGVLVPTRTAPSRLGSLDAGTRAALLPDAETLCVAYPDGDGWDVLARRAGSQVAVWGLGRAGLALATHLARAGVGTLLLDDDGRVREQDVAPGGYRRADVGRHRRHAAAELLAEASTGVSTAPAAGSRPDLLVLVGYQAVDSGRAGPLLREDLSHLAVVLRERDAVVGPLVRPGTSACLRCLDLHRTDRDPEWPRIAPQLWQQGRRRGREETALSALAASLAAAQVLTHLDGRVRPASVDATLEASLPDGLVAVRPWSAHPECGCTWPPAAARLPAATRRPVSRPTGGRHLRHDTMGA